MPETEPSSDVAALTVQLLSAYLSNNTIASEDLSELIRSTRAALAGEPEAAEAMAEAEAFTPAVSVRKSLATSEHIISLIDGKPYKTLKRHLTSHGLTPEAYRSRYNLPPSYPMVAPDYAAHRRAVAQKVGLGRRRPDSPSVVDEPNAPAVAEPSQDTPELEMPATVKPKASSKTAARGGEKKARPARDAGPAAPMQRAIRGSGGKASTQDAESAPHEAAGAGAEPEAGVGTRKRRGRIGLFKPADAQPADDATEGRSGDGTASATESQPQRPQRRRKSPTK